MVHIMPDSMGARSFRAFAIGARQLVVQDAAEMILSSFVRVLWLSLIHILHDRKVGEQTAVDLLRDGEDTRELLAEQLDAPAVSYTHLYIDRRAQMIYACFTGSVKLAQVFGATYKF